MGCRSSVSVPVAPELPGAGSTSASTSTSTNTDAKKSLDGCASSVEQGQELVGPIGPDTSRWKATGIDIGSGVQGSGKFRGICALDSKLYCAPYNASKLLEYNTTTGRLREIDIGRIAEGDHKYVGICALGPKLFCAPCEASKLLEYDTATRRLRGIDIRRVADCAGLFSGICALGSKIFCAPYNENRMLEYDTATDQRRGIDIRSVATCGGKFSGICALGSKIFCAPYEAAKLLEYDSITGKVRGIDISSVVAKGHGKFMGICALGSKLYCAPFCSPKLLEYDTATGRLQGIDVRSTKHGDLEFTGICALGSKLFLVPGTASHLLEYDTITGQLRDIDIDIDLGCTTQAQGDLNFREICALGPRVFLAPFHASQLLVLGPTFQSLLEDAEKLASSSGEEPPVLLPDWGEFLREAAVQEEALKAQQNAGQQELARLRAAGKAAAAAMQSRAEAEQGVACTFYFLKADALRECNSRTLPGHQTLLREHPDWFCRRTVRLQDTESRLREDQQPLLVVSHRWESSAEPDPSGVQLEELRRHLRQRAELKLVWLDYWCMPQGAQSEEELLAFRTMLPNIHLLYLSGSVLVLMDSSYLSRFWTQFEAWLAMQTVSSSGLRPAEELELRCAVVCLHDATAGMAQALRAMWRSRTVQQAHDLLSKPEVAVTKASDKQLQLAKLSTLGSLVKSTLQS